MKMTKAEKEAYKTSIKASIRKSMKTNTVVDDRVTSVEPYIEVKEQYKSISRFLKGAYLGDWEDAEVEKVMYQKALGQDSSTQGGVLVPPVFVQEIIPLLKDKVVVRSMPGVRTVDMGKAMTMTWPRVATGPTVTWGSEAATISEDTTLDFGTNTLDAKKCVSLYKISNELLMNANPSVDTIVKQELTDAMALEEDKVFLEGTGGVKPLGLYYNPRVRSTDLSGNLSVDDLKEALYQIRLGQASATGWIGHPRTKYDLARLKDAEGRPLFGTVATNPGVGVPTMGDLWGLPFKDTTQIGITLLPGSDETYLVVGDWKNLWIGEKQGMRLDVSKDIYFTTDQVAIRLVRHVGATVVQPGTISVISGIISP